MARRLTGLGARLGGRVLRNRRLVRAPIWLYQHGLGWLLGHRMLMLEHRGRRSGLARHVVLEVVDRPRPDRYLVVSGFGERAQWFRNVRADPRVRVSVARERDRPATATLLSDAERDAALAAYARKRPRTWEQLRATMEQALGTPVATLPVVALDLDAPS